MEKKRKNGYSRQVGVWIPAALLALPIKRTPAANLAEKRARKERREITLFAAAILNEFPGCPAEEAERIAQHACETGSGRVGRSRMADDPVRAAVVAHVRHVHTKYDTLLFAGTEREDARDIVRDDITAVLREWEVPPVSNDPVPVVDGRAAVVA